MTDGELDRLDPLEILVVYLVLLSGRGIVNLAAHLLDGQNRIGQDVDGVDVGMVDEIRFQRIPELLDDQGVEDDDPVVAVHPDDTCAARPRETSESARRELTYGSTVMFGSSSQKWLAAERATVFAVLPIESLMTCMVGNAGMSLMDVPTSWPSCRCRRRWRRRRQRLLSRRRRISRNARSSSVMRTPSKKLSMGARNPASASMASACAPAAKRRPTLSARRRWHRPGTLLRAHERPSSASQPRATSARFAARVYAVARFSERAGLLVARGLQRIDAGDRLGRLEHAVAITAAMQSGA